MQVETELKSGYLLIIKEKQLTKGQTKGWVLDKQQDECLLLDETRVFNGFQLSRTNKWVFLVLAGGHGKDWTVGQPIGKRVVHS